jgi:hypothetical protein
LDGRYLHDTPLRGEGLEEKEVAADLPKPKPNVKEWVRGAGEGIY